MQYKAARSHRRPLDAHTFLQAQLNKQSCTSQRNLHHCLSCLFSYGLVNAANTPAGGGMSSTPALIFLDCAHAFS